MTNPHKKQVPLALAFGLTAWACTHEVRPDSMSAEEHRQEADKAMIQAHTEVVRASVTPPVPPPPLGVSAINPTGYAYPLDVYNPSEAHLVRARQLEAHAHQHQTAATKLETFVQDECKGFPPESRSVCPLLGPATQIVDIAGGVRVTFTPKTRVDAVAAHMRCHFAHAQAHGFDTLIDCPLYVRGLQIRLTDDAKAIELTSQDAATAEVIRARSREEVVLVNQ
jgi:hypothetical protein